MGPIGSFDASYKYTFAGLDEKDKNIANIKVDSTLKYIAPQGNPPTAFPFQIVKAAVGNANSVELPFEWHYSLEAPNYARATGGLLLVRPRVVGVLTRSFLETREDRREPIEFEGPTRDTDVVDITLPEHYKVDELPPPVNADYGFATYRSKTELAGGKLHFSRSFEIKQLSLPASKAGELKELYRIIAGDERNTAVLVRTP